MASFVTQEEIRPKKRLQTYEYFVDRMVQEVLSLTSCYVARDVFLFLFSIPELECLSQMSSIISGEIVSV